MCLSVRTLCIHTSTALPWSSMERKRLCVYDLACLHRVQGCERVCMHACKSGRDGRLMLTPLVHVQQILHPRELRHVQGSSD